MKKKIWVILLCALLISVCFCVSTSVSAEANISGDKLEVLDGKITYKEIKVLFNSHEIYYGFIKSWKKLDRMSRQNIIMHYIDNIELEQHDKTINKENMDKIKEYLGTARQKMAIKNKVDVYVPEILNDILDELKLFIMDSGVELIEAINIQYGKKLRFMYQHKEAGNYHKNPLALLQFWKTLSSYPHIPSIVEGSSHRMGCFAQ